jgi:hypothetical protein
MTRYLFLSDSYVLVSVGHPLWREDGSVFCMCRWPLPAQSFSGPSPLGLATVFYCLRFETSLFVTSYDSQGHGGGIRPRLHTGRLLLGCCLCYINPCHRCAENAVSNSFSIIARGLLGFTHDHYSASPLAWWLLPSNGSARYSAPFLRLFVMNSLPVYHHFFPSEFCVCDVCGRSHLPSPWLISHGDYSPVAPSAPSLRPLIPSSSLMRC